MAHGVTEVSNPHLEKYEATRHHETIEYSITLQTGNRPLHEKRNKAKQESATLPQQQSCLTSGEPKQLVICNNPNTPGRSDETSAAAKASSPALYCELQVIFFFGEETLLFAGGQRATADLDIETARPEDIRALKSKIQGSGFNIVKILERGLDAVDRGQSQCENQSI
ncbi:uncharacterized protein DFL_003122 [Arthrobotrys flagrans]|uniref:Uncharacterized protein n=1 Tax=Arthrobotrys flagrans TaxID=97331 RepID=A0A437ACZ6_ARTFL|nr:hypothetical protein DFL_003122 [Arthrobotrys flagrans]